jgi:hypothetical protein
MEKAMKTDLTKYPITAEICDWFDCTVLTDCDSDDTKYWPLWAVGIQRELAAGIWGGALTPYFKTMEELEAHCATKIEAIRDFHEQHPEHDIPWELIEEPTVQAAEKAGN